MSTIARAEVIIVSQGIRSGHVRGTGDTEGCGRKGNSDSVCQLVPPCGLAGTASVSRAHDRPHNHEEENELDHTRATLSVELRLRESSRVQDWSSWRLSSPQPIGTLKSVSSAVQPPGMRKIVSASDKITGDRGGVLFEGLRGKGWVQLSPISPQRHSGEGEEKIAHHDLRLAGAREDVLVNRSTGVGGAHLLPEQEGTHVESLQERPRLRRHLLHHAVARRHAALFCGKKAREQGGEHGLSDVSGTKPWGPQARRRMYPTVTSASPRAIPFFGGRNSTKMRRSRFPERSPCARQEMMSWGMRPIFPWSFTPRRLHPERRSPQVYATTCLDRTRFARRRVESPTQGIRRKSSPNGRDQAHASTSASRSLLEPR